MPDVLSDADVAHYRREGYVTVADAVPPEQLQRMRTVTDEFVEQSRDVRTHDARFDLEPGHSAADPRVRRIKHPHRQHAAYGDVMRNPIIVGALKDLWGSVRFHSSKLNMKSAGFGSAIEWHQDWAFYPHTNDDVTAAGVMLDAATEENGAMRVIPGSHKGPTYDHHAHGRFCGAMDLEACGLRSARGETLIGLR